MEPPSHELDANAPRDQLVLEQAHRAIDQQGSVTSKAFGAARGIWPAMQ